MTRIALAVLAALCLGNVAQAQTTVIRGEDKVTYNRKTELTFCNVDITGELERPVGTIFTVKPKVKFASMIRLRANFTPELSDSVKHL